MVTGLFALDNHMLGYYLQEVLNENDLTFRVIAIGLSDCKL